MIHWHAHTYRLYRVADSRYNRVADSRYRVADSRYRVADSRYNRVAALWLKHWYRLLGFVPGIRTRNWNVHRVIEGLFSDLLASSEYHYSLLLKELITVYQIEKIIQKWKILQHRPFAVSASATQYISRCRVLTARALETANGLCLQMNRLVICITSHNTSR